MTGNRRTRARRSASQEPSGPNQNAAPAGDRNYAGGFPATPIDNRFLPALQTQQSFAYGARGSPALPRLLRPGPPQASGISASIEERLAETQATDFERIQEEARANPGAGRTTRSRANSRLSISPVRQTPARRGQAREPTPDDQLLESLREASEEPEESKEKVMKAIEDSSVSWNTERHVIGDPRSTSRASVADSLSGGASTVRGQRRQEQVGLSHPMTGPPLRPPPVGLAPAPQLGAIPVLTPPQAQSLANPIPSKPAASSSMRQEAPSVATTLRRKATLLSVIVTILFALMAFGGMVSRIGNVKGFISEGFGSLIGSPSSFCSVQPPSTEYADALSKFSLGVDQRLAVMGKDVAAIKDEWNKRLPLIKQALSWQEKEDPLLPRRVNWFSIGVGALVDPYLTTQKPRPNMLSWSVERAAGTKRTNPPISALARWEEHGDCWCVDDPLKDPQLAVALGRPIVPEEVVIEHIHKEATLDPESAPREMELWVEYSTRPEFVGTLTLPPGSQPTGGPSTYKRPEIVEKPELIESAAEARAAYSGTLSPSQREDVISTLRLAYPNDPETAYSQDPEFGANFYRIGKFQYDINGKHNVQRFLLDAVIDLPNIRTKKAVLRVKSNWGSVNTCLYRVRLHGNM